MLPYFIFMSNLFYFHVIHRLFLTLCIYLNIYVIILYWFMYTIYYYWGRTLFRGIPLDVTDLYISFVEKYIQW